MVKAKTKKTINWILFGIAAFIGFASHIMIFANKMPPEIQNAHAIINIVAWIMVSIVVFMNMKR